MTDTLVEMEKALRDRFSEIMKYRDLIRRIADIQLKISSIWKELCDKEVEQVKVLNHQQQQHLTVGGQHGGQYKQKTLLQPSRVGNYYMIAKRLQTEIKSLDIKVQNMKMRLINETQYKTELDNQIKNIRRGLSMDKHHDKRSDSLVVQ